MRKPYIDRKTLSVGLSLLLLLSLALCFLSKETGKIAALLITVTFAVLAVRFLRHRRMPSVNRRTALWISIAYAALYVTLLLLSGFHFGFYLADVPLSVSSLFKFVLPFAGTIIATEIIRGALLSGRGRLPWVIAFAVGFLSETLMQTTLTYATSFNRFMDLVGMILLPAIASQVLYQHLSKEYGWYPVLAYRLILTLSPYILPAKSGIPDSLVSFLSLVVPLGLFFFLRLLFTKQKRSAKERKRSKWERVGTVGFVLVMISFVMLISGQFRFRVLVIATESMTGELNKGDAVLYERYGDQTIEVDDVLVFDKDGSVIVHRVTEISHIDGETRYVTKGDANDDPDYGYITDASILGVTRAKLPYFGYPTLWLRQAFK